MSTGMTEAQRRANARWNANRRRLKAQGLWQPFVDAAPVRDRVRVLNGAGMPNGALTKRLDLPWGSLDHLVCQRNGEYSREVRTETAEALMNYWPVLDDFPPRSLIDGTGTRRRFEALMTLGWTQVAVAARIGVSNRSLSRALAKQRVTAELARQVRQVYDAVWMRQPRLDEVTAAGAHAARTHAQAHGLHGPLAWDDDTIDDPKTLPATDAVQPAVTEGENVADRWLHGESVVLGPEDRKQVLQHLFEWTNDSPEQIAARLEMTLDAVWQTWSRLKKKARDEGRREPWRRVYVPRERDLKQDELEEAA